MASFLVGFLLPSLLLAAALINWSVISFLDLIAFLLVHYIAPEIGKPVFPLIKRNTPMFLL
jgi:hypothetical protein